MASRLSFVAVPPGAENPPCLSAGREHAMTRDDDRNRIAAERLPDRACRRRIAKARGDFAVGQRRARRNRPRDLVDALMELRHAVHVERDEGKIRALAPHQSRHRVDDAPDIRRTAAVSSAPGEPRPSRRRVAERSASGSRKPETPRVAPDDPARSDRGVEERVRTHGSILAPRREPVSPEQAAQPPRRCTAVLRALLRPHELVFDLLPVLRIHRLGAAERRLARDAVELRQLVDRRVRRPAGSAGPSLPARLRTRDARRADRRHAVVSGWKLFETSSGSVR